jgi:broad specificity phosphatase PhoE
VTLQIYFLRHGETEYSKTGGFCGEVDADLTAEGHEMAKHFAAHYKSIPWTAIYASPMKRTIATASPLCELTGLIPITNPGLKEIAYGKWENKTADFVKQNYPDDYLRWLAEPAWNAPTDGESAVQISNRAMPVIYEIEQTYPTGNVLVVSHKATIRIILCSLLGIELGRYRDRINALAGSVSIVKFTDHGPLLELLGDRSYMPEALRSATGT